MKPGIGEAVKALGLAPAASPEPVSAWPPAYGWWILVVLIAAGAFLLYWIGYRRHLQPALKRLRERRRLQSELEPMLIQLEGSADTPAHRSAPARINVTLKSWAIRLGHRDAGRLDGDEWLQYLVEQAGLSHQEAAPLRLLGADSYRRTPLVTGGVGGKNELNEFRRSLHRLIRGLPAHPGARDA